jgi:hypothetical protein
MMRDVRHRVVGHNDTAPGEPMPPILVEPMPRPGKDVDFKEWLVPARNNIQRQMLRLRMRLDGKHDQRVAVALNWLAGVGFSLWRAAFQVREGLESNTVVAASKEFLDKIIRDNAAMYQTELNTWSLGYYLGNARLRLVTVGLSLWPYKKLSPKLAKLLKQLQELMSWSTPRTKRDAYLEWEECFACFCLMLDEIEDHEDVPF